MKALIVGAGQGKRLLPLTETVPKALIEIGGKSLLAWQLEALVACGVNDIVFVGGFNIAAVEQALGELTVALPNGNFRAVFNPFHETTDNLVTCWSAREEMAGDFILLNSDTLFAAPVLTTLLAAPPAPVTVAIDHKESYDDDDMKVELDGTRLLDIGKKLEHDRVHGESIGMLLFRGDGPGIFRQALETAMLTPAALKQWYLSVIAALARDIEVHTVAITGATTGGDWCEIDFPRDLPVAEEMIARWQTPLAAARRS